MYELNQVETQSGGEGYCSVSVDEGIAALSEGLLLPERSDLVVDIPSWIVLEYCTRYGRKLNARRFVGMFSDG